MNASRVYDRITREWRREYSSNVGEIKLTKNDDDSVEFETHFEFPKYFDDDIFCEVTIYTSGTIHVFFTFDKLSKNYDNYDLVNEFNARTAFAKGYIKTIKGRDNVTRDFFRIHYAYASCADEAEGVENIRFSLENLISDSVLDLLEPITDETV